MTSVRGEANVLSISLWESGVKIIAEAPAEAVWGGKCERMMSLKDLIR
jgi:hypothetical protein